MSDLSKSFVKEGGQKEEKREIKKETDKRNKWREDILETELRFDSGITRAMLSGICRHTIRLGRRKFRNQITIHGHQALVSFVKHTSLLHTDLRLLNEEFGWHTMFNALLGLQKFYPGIKITDEITIVKYRLLV